MCTNRTSPECPKHPVQPLHHTLVKNQHPDSFRTLEARIIHSVLVRGRSRCRSQYLSVPPVFKTGSQAVVIHLPFF